MDLYELIGKMHKLELVRKLVHRREAEEFKLYFGQMPVLNYVAANPGCTQVEIANFLQVSPASIALSTKRLQKAGYLVKEVDRENLRCKRIYLSEEGASVRDICRCRLDAVDVKEFEGFTQEELALLSSFIDRATMNLTGEKENVVSGEVFHSLHRQLGTMDRSKDED